MFSGLKKLWKFASEEGMRLPFIQDPVSKKPSITLLFPYITFVLAFISTIFLHFFPSVFLATTTSIVFWVLSVVFYQIRKLQKAKFDLDDKSIELNSGDN